MWDGKDRDEYGNYVYHKAAKNIEGDFIGGLLQKGARLTRTDERGNNGIHLILGHLYYKMKVPYPPGRTLPQDLLDDYLKSNDRYIEQALIGIKAFLDAGVDPDDKNGLGETAHVLAKRFKSKDFLLTDRRADQRIAALLKGEAAPREDVNGFDENGVLPLALACACCDIDEVKRLLDAGADPNKKTGDGRSPVWWLGAYYTAHYVGITTRIERDEPFERIVGYMVQKGLNINDTIDDRYNTLLTAAVSSEKYGIDSVAESLVKTAIRYHADVNKADISGRTPLMLACAPHIRYDANNVQRMLLEAGADIFAKDTNGNTPAIYAACNGNEKAAFESVENLSDFGKIDAEQVNYAGKSALDYAIENGNDRLTKLLLKIM